MKTISLKTMALVMVLVASSMAHAARHSTTNCANKNSGGLVGNTNPRYVAATPATKSTTTNVNNAESRRN